MGVYATVADLDSAGISRGGLDAEELLRRAEVDVDNFIGQLPVGDNGRKFDPDSLEDARAERSSSRRWRSAPTGSAQGEDAMSRTDDYLPPDLQPFRRGGVLSRQAAAELADTGLIVWSGTVAMTT